MISSHTRKYHLTDLPFLKAVGENAINVDVLIKLSIGQGIAGIQRLSRPGVSSFLRQRYVEGWELQGGQLWPPASLCGRRLRALQMDGMSGCRSPFWSPAPSPSHCIQ